MSLDGRTAHRRIGTVGELKCATTKAPLARTCACATRTWKWKREMPLWQRWAVRLLTVGSTRG